MQLSVPDGAGAGRGVPVAGLTWVGVHPDHRRRGLLTAMMRHHFEQTRREGVRAHRAARERAGHLRSARLRAGLPRARGRGRPRDARSPHPTSTTRLRRALDPSPTITDDGVAERRRRIDLDLMSECVGTIVGDDDFYAMLNHLSPQEKRDGEPPRILFAVRDGRDVGYVVFKRKHKWPNSRPAAEVEVSPISGGPAARLALARRVVDLDLAGSVKIHGIAESRPAAVLGAGPARARRRPPLRQPVGAARRPAGGLGAAWLRGRLRRRRRRRGRVGPVERRALADPGQGRHGRRDPDRRRRRGLPSGHRAGCGVPRRVRTSWPSTAPACSTEHRPGAVRDLWRAFRTDVGPYATRGF